VGGGRRINGRDKRLLEGTINLQPLVNFRGLSVNKDVAGQKRAFIFLLNCGETTYADIPATQF
jgi:hypothetical protein